eukprot:2081300-Amphidinium_carterae.1
METLLSLGNLVEVAVFLRDIKTQLEKMSLPHPVADAKLARIFVQPHAHEKLSAAIHREPFRALPFGYYLHAGAKTRQLSLKVAPLPAGSTPQAVLCRSNRWNHPWQQVVSFLLSKDLENCSDHAVAERLFLLDRWECGQSEKKGR